jgi:hypothetical protein
MARSVLASCLAFAGVYVLAGAGWALLAGAFLTFALWPSGADTALSGAFRASAERFRRLAAWAVAAPKRAVATAGMGGGVALVPAGLALSAGGGVAVVAAGALLIGVALLTGWGA